MDRTKKVKEYLKKGMKEGFEEKEVEKHLNKIGISKKEIKKAKEEVIVDKAVGFDISRYKEPMLIAGAGLVILTVIILFIMSMPKNCGYDLECFEEIAEVCGKAVLKKSLDNTIVRYYTNDCILKKSIESVDDEELPEVKELEGISMECDYDRGDFSIKFVDYLAYGLDVCKGPLKTALEEIKILKNEVGG